jgi:thiamine pyrophosphokinase
MDIAVILKAPFLTEKVIEEKVIYADAGYKFKDLVGEKEILAVVGDFDSLKTPPKDQKTINLNVEKDFTDGERAIRYAVELGAKNISIYGAYGGNIDHILGNIALLKIAKELGLNAIIKDDGKNTVLISKESRFKVKKGGTVSIIPYGGDCSFIDSKGLYYPLKDVTLTTKDTRGISNRAESQEIIINIKSGEALIIYER